MKDITIILENKEIRFVWKYKWEANNWHYYEDEEWTLYHVRKDKMVVVIEKNL